MARIESRPPYDASFPQAGSGEFSRIAQEAAKKRSEEKAQEQAQAQERAYAVTEPTPKEEVVEATPIEEPTLKEPIAKPKVKPMPFPRVSFQEDAPRARKEEKEATPKEQKPKANPMPYPRYSFQEDAPWAVNGISPKAPAIPATPQKKAEKPSATTKGEATDIGVDLDPHIVAGHRVSFQEDAPWAKDNPYAFGLEQGFQNRNKFAGKSYDELDKDAVITSNSLTMGIIGRDPAISKELKRRKQRLNDFNLIASAPEALAEYGITLSPETCGRIKNEILLGTDSLKDLTPLLQKAKRVKYEEGKEKQRTISQVSDRAYQLEREMKRAGATKEADKAMKSDATMAMMLPSPTSAQIWKITSYNDKLPDTYRAAMQLQEHANELSQLNKSFLSNLEKEKNWAGGVWEGFKNNILTRKAWQDKEGNTYAANEMALYRVIQAYNNGDNSPEVKKVVEMAAELNSAEAFMRSILPKGYEAGESTAGSIPFMIDFIVTSALTGGAGSAEKAASKVGASGVKALATRGILTASGKGTRFLELLTRYGQKAAQGVKGVATAVAEKAPGVTRMGGRIVKDATQAAIMTATLNAPSVASDAERRVTPIPYKLEEGDIDDISEFIPINEDHILMEKRFMERNRNKAFRKAFTSQWIENYSELAGGHFDTYLKALGKLTNFSGTAAGKAIARFNSALSKAPVVGSVRRAANIQGLGGEFAEEIYGGMLNAWLVGDQKMKEVFDAKNMGTTLEALLPTQIAFGILGGGSHALSLAGNQRQLAKINKQLKEEFGDTGDEGKRWEKLTLSEQGKVLDGLTGVYRDAMRRSNEAKDDATRQAAIKEATYARLLFMRLGLQTRRSVLQGAEAEAKLEQTQDKFNTLKQEAENALKAEANRTTTDRAGNSVTVRYNDKEYSVYNTEGVTIGQDEKGEPRVLGKGTLYLRAPETEEGNAEIIPVPSDQVKVVAVQPKEDVDAAIEQSAKAVAKAAIQPELATQEVASAPMAQEAESTPAVQEAESVPTAQEAKSAPTRQEAKSAPTRQEAESVPTRQEAESAPIAQEAESVPMSQEAESVPMSQEAESAPMSQEAESAPMSQEAESALKAEAPHTATNREGDGVKVRYNNKEYTIYDTKGVFVGENWNGNPRLFGKGTLYLRANDADGGSTEIIPVPSDQVEVIRTHPTEVVPAPMAQEAESAPMAQEAESAPMAQEAESAPTAQGAENAPMAQEAETAPAVQETESAPMAQEAKSAPMAQEAKSAPMAQEAKSTPMAQEAKSVPTVQEAKSVPTVQEAKSVPTMQESESIPMAQEVESAPMAQEAESTPMTQKAESTPMAQSSEQTQGAQTEAQYLSPEEADNLSTEERTEAVGNAPVGMQNREGNRITLTDASGNRLTVRLSDEKDRNGKPYVLTSDGKLSYGVIPGGLVPEEPKTKEVRLSLGNQDDSSINYRYGLIHIMEKHFAQLKELGFDTVEAYIKHVLKNIGGAVLDKIYAGKTTHFVFTTPFSSENHPKQKRVDTVIVELHEESDHWDIINTWRSTEAYIKKKKEKRGTVPSIGLSHAADKTEVFDESTTRSSGSQREGNSPRFSSTDKDTKKSEPSDVPLEKGTNDAEGEQRELTLTDYKGKSVTVRLSDEKDRNGKPYVLTSDGKLSYGVVPGGLLSGETEAKEVRISLGDDDYGMTRMIITKGIKESGFKTVEAYIQHVLRNASQMKQYEFLSDSGYQIITHPFASTFGEDTIDILYVIPSADGTFWEITKPWRTTEKHFIKSEAEGKEFNAQYKALEEKPKKDSSLREPHKNEAFRIGNEPSEKRISERTWHKLVDRLGKSGLATEFVTDSKAFSEKLNSLRRSERELIGGKTVFGFVDKRTGSVYLNPETMDANTPLHECAHLWNALIRNANPELWARGRYLIEQSPYAVEVRNEAAYSGLSAEERADEALARAIADRGEKILKQSGMRGLALRAWIRDVWQHILAFFGIKKKAKTLNDLTDMALGDLLNSQADSYEIPKEKEASQILFRIGNKRRAEYRDRLQKKRADLSDVAIEKTLDAIEAFGEEEAGNKGDSKLETLALHWTLNGSIDLTREADAKDLDDIPDSTLVRQAAEAARRKKVDPMQYESPKLLLSDIAEGMTFDKRLDPDKEPCFTQKRKVPGTDIVTYKVEDTEKGQRAVRAFVDSHWGVNANPWCLISRNADACRYWNHYNYIQKRIAFQSGKLLAFKACDEEGTRTPWWDRRDENSEGVPYREDLEGGKYLPISVNETTGEPMGKTSQYALRGERGGDLYEEWTPDGKHLLLRERHYGANKSHERWTPKGVLTERHIWENGKTKAENWNAHGRLILSFISNKGGNVYSEWYDNGRRKAFKLERNGNIYSIEWDKKGKRSFLEAKDKEGNERTEYYYENGKCESLEVKDKDGSERKEEWYENGKHKLLEVKDKDGSERKEQWYENGKHKLLETKDKEGNEHIEEWNEKGKRQSLETKNKDGSNHYEEWHVDGQHKSLRTIDKEGTRYESWYKNGQHEILETTDKDGNLRIEIWNEEGDRIVLETRDKNGESRREELNELGGKTIITKKKEYDVNDIFAQDGTRRVFSIVTDDYNLLSFSKSGEIEGGTLEDFAVVKCTPDGLQIETQDGWAVDKERAKKLFMKCVRIFEEVTGEKARLVGAEDVQYRKGKQGKGARPLDAPLETFTPERAHDTLAKLRAAKPIAVDVAKARELYEFTPKGVRTWILNTLRNRTFKNEDTGEDNIVLARPGADKFASHGMNKEARVASALVIPELINKGIFIGERNAEEGDAKYTRYRYYLAGLNVGSEEYTAKIIIGIDKYGKSFYDQELTAIEKGRLIDMLNQPAEGFTTTAVGPIPSSALTGKDTKLLSLLGDLTEKAGEAWEATSNPQSAEDEVTQHDVYRRALTTQYGEATRDAETDKARKQRVAEDALRKLGLEGVPVEVVSRGDVAEAYARDAMGWHDRKTGKVTIVAENNELEDIEATVLHEVVGHHGLEVLLGKEGVTTLTHEVLPLIPEAERKRLEDTYGTNEQTIAEEYIAGMAEQYTPPSLWARIAGFIRNALRRIGFRLPLTNGDLLYLTWLGIRATRKEQSSTDTLLHRADEKRVIARCQELDDIQFRKPRKQILSELAADGVDEKGVLKLTEAMNELLEKRVYKLRETWQNDTQSFIELARCVEAATGETIPDEMNIDKVYNQSASKAFARQEETRKKYDRMMQAVRYFARKAQLSPELTELYFLAKHAPERNAEMRRRAEELFDPTTRTEEQEDILNNYYTNLFPGWNKQNGDAYASEAEAREAFLGALKDALTTKDYAAEEAITERIATLIKQDKKSPYKAITDEGNLLNAFTEAVEARAGHQDVYHVWQLVNGFNRGTIELWRSSGMIDEATYQKVTGMFAHYVPMQGWKENTNQTPWEYNIRAHIDTNPLKTMHGRQSLPGSPFEAMLKSAMNSIVAATRNEERQALYFFAQRYGSDYLSASSAWYVLQKEGDTKRWVEAYPETVTRKTEKGDAIESTTQETAEAFFARMKELEAKGLARQRTQSTRPETGYLLSERQEQEHVVPLFFDGQKYNVFVNGNPRFSRAATRHNRASDANGAADKLLRSVRWFTREMGQNITGRSLSFGAANMVRDLLFAEMSSSTIYGTRYALAFNRAYFTDVIPLMLGLKKGDTARLYNEYKANGGRTGFAFLTGDKRSTRSTRNALSNSLTARAGRAGRSFWNAYMGINEHLEDMSRFAAYAAARKMGLGITEATHRAKSITVNFNKRGTGNSPMYQFLSTLYLFFNANLQGVALTGKMFRDHPKRAAAWSIGLILLQPLMTLLYTALANPGGDDDDEDEEDKGETLQEKYDRLPLKDVNPFLRQSNLCIPMGEGKLLKVPLGPEMRALNGIGVTLSDMLMGRATSGDVALATIDGALNSSSIGLDASISSLANANELAERGENGALYTALRGAVPSALQPFGDIAANRDWSGRRIYGESVYHRGTPSYLYADKSTPRWMTNAAAGWNTMLYGQGDKHIGEVSTGLLSVNPSSVNYLAERYLGGILEFVTDINRATDMLTDKNEGSVSQALGQAPVTRRFWKDDPLMQGSEARRNFYSTRRALRQDIERIDRMRRNAKNADYKEANEIRNSIRTYLDGRNEMQLRYLAKRFDTLSDTMKAHDEAYAGKDTETRLSVRERDTRAIERLLKEAERLEAVTK